VGGDGGSQDLGAGTFNHGQYTLNESTPTPFSFPGGFPPSALPLDPSAFQWTPEQFQQLFAQIPGAPQGGLQGTGGVPTPESIQAAAQDLAGAGAGAGAGGHQHQGLGTHLASDALLATLPQVPPHVPAAAAAPHIAPASTAPAGAPHAVGGTDAIPTRHHHRPQPTSRPHCQPPPRCSRRSPSSPSPTLERKPCFAAARQIRKS
jgi:hypothetical protein